MLQVLERGYMLGKNKSGHGLKIRLSMGGVRKRPVYKIVVADSRAPRDGRFVEKIGLFNPLLPKDKKERITTMKNREK